MSTFARVEKYGFIFLLMLAFAPLIGVQAQEIDDVEAEMDAVISESDAAQSAEEYARKKQAEEKQKLKQAEKAAEKTAVKAAAVKEASLGRVADLEKQTAQLVAEKKVFDARTQKLNDEIARHEALVREAEEKLKTAQEDKRLAVEANSQAKEMLAQKKLELKKLQEERMAALAEKKKARRELASTAHSMPGKTINMAKNCAVHSDMEKSAKVVAQLKKGEKVSLAKITNEGWFYAKGASAQGFIHKSCE